MKKKITQLILTSIIILITISSCTNNPDINIICNTDLTEGKETLYFQGDYGDRKRSMEQFFDFEIYKHRYNVEISFDRPIINSYKDALRTPLNYNAGWEEFYDLFLNDDQDLYLLYGVLETLKSRTIGTDYDIIQMIVGFVQSIPYDEYAADVNYPYETLAFNSGDCDEKSILLCKLLNLEGYDACLFIYEEEKHMAVGLKVAESGYYRNGYVFIESTNTFPIGMRGKSSDGKESKEEPLVIYAKQNAEGYYEQYLDIEDCYKEIAIIHGESYLQNNIKGKKILEKMNGFKNEIDSINVNRSFLEKKLMKYANEMDSLTKIIDEKYIIPYPDGISDSEIYEEYTLIFNEKNKLNELRNDIVNDYNNSNNSAIFDEYNKLIESFNQAQQEKSPNTRTILDLES
jgi:hypothetical protein|tara:strand:- start:622 stop:1827 length:1206 start_codon:yes stop_codon:yes gene_type:complete